MRSLIHIPRFTRLGLAMITLLVMVPALSACLPPASGTPRDSADPFIVQVGKQWYLFSTQTDINKVTYEVPVWSSTDKQNWHLLGDALPVSRKPAWASTYFIWAPAVLQRPDGVWVLYVSLVDQRSGHHVIAVATAGSPAGPYNGRPYPPLQSAGSAGEPTHGAIDPSPVAYGGHEYLLWKSNPESPGPAPPATIWARQLAPDAMSWATGSHETLLLKARPDWTTCTIEAPAMWPTLVGSYLFYSGGCYLTPSYAIGWASCPAGPTAGCIDQSTSGPWLSSFDHAYGPGGEEIVRQSGPAQLVYHAWTNVLSRDPTATRRIWIANLNIDSNWRPTLS
jgi:hypothetical protein